MDQFSTEFNNLTMGPRHVAFAASILAAMGNLLIIPGGWGKSPTYTLNDGRLLTLIEGAGADRNGSGIALELQDAPGTQERWLLTGDVDYSFLFGRMSSSSYQAIAVPHHGASPKSVNAVPAPSKRQGFCRLVYSFGHDNTFKHPRSDCIDAHQNQNWNHNAWLPANIGKVVAGGDVLATACDAPAPAHLGNIAVRWTGPLAVPIAVPCNPPMCNASITQS